MTTANIADLSNTPNGIDLAHAIPVLIKHHGFPTFEEFRKDPEKYLGRSDELLESAQNSSQAMKKLVRKQTYVFEGYKVDTLEQIERICRDEGIDMKTGLEMLPKMFPVGNQVDIVVTFRRKQGKIIL